MFVYTYVHAYVHCTYDKNSSEIHKIITQHTKKPINVNKLYSLHEFNSLSRLILNCNLYFRLCLYHRDVGPSNFVADSIIQVN